jgi:hypothetical protein
MRLRIVWGAGLMAVALTACSEAPQTLSKGKSDTQAWQGGANAAFTAEGWKRGDEASWEQQIRTRGQSQNEYNRITP